MNDKDPESAHDVKSPGSEPEQKPNRKMRRKQEKFIAQEKKANNAKKGKSLTKSEMITIARQRQGLPPLEPKKKVLAQERLPNKTPTIRAKLILTTARIIVFGKASERISETCLLL